MKISMQQQGNTNGREKAKRSRGLSWLLDESIPLPGGYRIGLDGIIGLIPGVGDAIGGGLSTWIFYQGVKQGVPKSILIHMLINIMIDFSVGAIPLVGDVFDFFWKANQKNAALLEQYRKKPVKTQRQATFSSVFFFTGVVVLTSIMIWAIISLLSYVIDRSF